jgi:SET domain-containing protein
VRALAPLPRGAFVADYAGEYLSTRDARARLAGYDASGSGHALLVARVVLPSAGSALRLNVDGTRRGNVARFINHSCDGGNLDAVLVMAKGARRGARAEAKGWRARSSRRPVGGGGPRVGRQDPAARAPCWQREGGSH